MSPPRPAELDPRSRRQRRHAAAVARAEARERRWAEHRYAVPYDTEGPKVTLGVLWFAALVAAGLYEPRGVLLVTAPVAVVAALQAARAWRFDVGVEPWLVAVLAAVVAMSGVGDATALGVAVLGSVAVSVVAGFVREGGERSRSTRLAEVTVRVAVPVGVAAASLAALAARGPGLFVSLVLVISIYEAGDFLIGSGSTNAFEGPVAGVVSALIVGAVLLVVRPFGDADGRVLVATAVVLAPGGQLLASAVLPKGAAWAPALRRLDSYLLAAPLWLVLA